MAAAHLKPATSAAPAARMGCSLSSLLIMRHVIGRIMPGCPFGESRLNFIVAGYDIVMLFHAAHPLPDQLVSELAACGQQTAATSLLMRESPGLPQFLLPSGR